MAELVFIDPRVDPRYPAELDLRFRVLREPLGLPREMVTFAGEEDALHLLATDGERAVGCVLFHFESGRLRAMAVDPSRQRTGLGRSLVLRLEQELALRGVFEVSLHARLTALPFYERLGYVAHGAPFLEVALQHRAMTKRLH